MTDDQIASITLPYGGETIISHGADGWPIRTMMWRPEAAPSLIVLLNGRGDFIEKYAELIGWLLSQGFAVAAMDWRGQGLSGETTAPPRRTHIGDFSMWGIDAQLWMTQIIQPRWHGRLLLLAHSMGGHLALRWLHDDPTLFARAVLLAPMLGVQAAPFSPKFARRVAALAVRLGRAETFAFGQLPYGPWFHSELRMSRLTSDKARFAQDAFNISHNPALAIGGLSFGWLDAAFRSFDLLFSAGYAAAIRTPTLALMAERDMLVDNAATQRFMALLPHGDCELVADGRHELFRERDAIRISVLETIHQFLLNQAA